MPSSYYFDTSAIAKRYHREAGTDWIRMVCATQTRNSLYLSDIVRVEVVAALRKAGRLAGMHPSSVDALVAIFERHLVLSEASRPSPLYLLVPATTALLTSAGELCNRYWDVTPYPLRSLDAIQIASAKAVAAGLSEELIFVTADTRQGAIAALEGLHIVDPAHPPRHT